jgi:hypothetical protein
MLPYFFAMVLQIRYVLGIRIRLNPDFLILTGSDPSRRLCRDFSHTKFSTCPNVNSLPISVSVLSYGIYEYNIGKKDVLKNRKLYTRDVTVC